MKKRYKHTEDELLGILEELECETLQLLIERDELFPSKQRKALNKRIWDNQEKIDKIEKRLETNQFKKIPDVPNSQWEKVGVVFIEKNGSDDN